MFTSSGKKIQEPSTFKLYVTGSHYLSPFIMHAAHTYTPTILQIANFTLEEKVSVTTGVGWAVERCVGNIPAIEPVDGRGWPGLCLQVRISQIGQAERVLTVYLGLAARGSYDGLCNRISSRYKRCSHVHPVLSVLTSLD
jgi:hypothetical protein